MIKEYLIKEKKMAASVATMIEKKISKYEDIRMECELWVRTKKYKVDDPIVVAGYTASDFNKIAPHMDGVEIYSFMITLRDEPDKAREHIRKKVMR